MINTLDEVIARLKRKPAFWKESIDIAVGELPLAKDDNEREACYREIAENIQRYFAATASEQSAAESNQRKED